MKKISVYSGKGGVGKSTLSINLAGYFAQEGLKVCVVDTDEQQTIADIYTNNLCGFDVRTKAPARGYDVVIFDHHPTHQNIALADFVICPIRPSRVDFESYRRSRAIIGDRPHILVVNQWQEVTGDDKAFIKKIKAMCNTNKLPFNTIKMRNIFKRMTNNAQTVFEAENKYGAREARNEVKALGAMINV